MFTALHRQCSPPQPHSQHNCTLLCCLGEDIAIDRQLHTFSAEMMEDMRQHTQSQAVGQHGSLDSVSDQPDVMQPSVSAPAASVSQTTMLLPAVSTLEAQQGPAEADMVGMTKGNGTPRTEQPDVSQPTQPAAPPAKRQRRSQQSVPAVDAATADTAPKTMPGLTTENAVLRAEKLQLEQQLEMERGHYKSELYNLQVGAEKVV